MGATDGFPFQERSFPIQEEPIGHQHCCEKCGWLNWICYEDIEADCSSYLHRSAFGADKLCPAHQDEDSYHER